MVEQSSYVTTGSPFKTLGQPQTKNFGTEPAGEVAAGAEFKVGDRVFGLNAGPGHFGAHAEFVYLRESLKGEH